MLHHRLLTDFRLVNGDGFEGSFQEYLADFNILAIRRVPVSSHGPATKLLERLLAENRAAQDVTVCGFDIVHRIGRASRAEDRILFLRA